MTAPDESDDRTTDAPDDRSTDADARDDAVTAEAVDEETVVRTAAEAAEGVVFSRFRNSDVEDLDVTVSFEDAVLEVDVYLDASGDAEPDQVAEDAALAARGAVDDLLE